MRAILLLLALAATCPAANPIPPQAPTAEFVWAVTDRPNADQPRQGAAVVELRERGKVIVKAPESGWGAGAPEVEVRQRATPLRNVLGGRKTTVRVRGSSGG